MGNKLSVGEERESMSAVLDYLKDNGILTLPKNLIACRATTHRRRKCNPIPSQSFP